MKRAAYIIAIVLISLLLVFGMLLALLHNSDVQTAVLRVATEELSRGLGAQAQIGKMAYRFPARLLLQDVYIEDQQGDTLLYVQEIYGRLRISPLLDNKVQIHSLRLHHAVVNGYTLPEGGKNFDFLLRAFASDEPAQVPNMVFGANRVNIDDVRVRYDDWRGTLEHLSLRIDEVSKYRVAFDLTQLSGALQRGELSTRLSNTHISGLWNDTILAFPTMYIELPHSILDLSGIRLTYPQATIRGSEFFACAGDSLLFAAQVRRAELMPSDIAVFVPALAHVDRLISLQARLDGRLDSLMLRELALYDQGEHILTGNVQIQGLPNIHQAIFRAECEDCSVSALRLQDILSQIKNEPVTLPEPVRRLGTMHYKGLLTGTVHDLQLKGAFRSAIGTITTDARVRSDSLFTDMQVNGRVSSRKLRLGRLLGVADLGTISLDVKMDDHLYPDGTMRGKAVAQIKELCYRGYCYQHISLDGAFTQNSFRGEAKIDDEHIQVAFNGLVELDGNNSETDFQLAINRLSFGPLNLSNKYRHADLSMRMRAHTVGLRLDSIIGYLQIDSLQFRNGEDSIRMEELEVIMQNESPHKMLKLTSDYAAMCIKGDYSYSTLLTTLKKQALLYMPELFTPAQRRAIKAEPSDNDITFYLYGRQIRKLQRTLDMPFFISDYPVLKGYLDEKHNLLGLQSYVPYIRLKNGDIGDITLSIFNNRDTAHATVSASWYDSQYTLHSTMQNNTVDVHLMTQDSVGYVTSRVSMSADVSQKDNQPMIHISTLPSYINVMDSTFFLSKSDIRYTMADTLLEVRGLRFGTGSQYLMANGVASTRYSDSLRVELSNLRLGSFLPFVVAEETIVADGSLSGWAHLYGLFSAPMFEADVRLDSARLNESPIGDAVAKVALDRSNNTIVIDADVVDEEHRVAHLDGLVDPAKNYWGLEIYPDSFKLDFINHWTAGILSDIGGRAWGKVKVFGIGPETWVLAQAYAQEGTVTIPYTGCKYTFSDSVYMDSTAIRFEQIDLHDVEGNIVHLNGVLNHESFKNFRFNITAQPEHALAINLPDKPGEWLQGKVYADGLVEIKGDDDNVYLEASAKAVGKSRFRMSVAGASSASESDFIRFVDHNAVEIEVDEDDFKNVDQAFLSRKYLLHGDRTRFQLAMNIDITPELLFQLVLNDRTGDMIQGRGEGALRFTYDDASEDMHLRGTYTLYDGSMDYTIGNLVRRRFTLGEGSTVTWSSVPWEPDLNVTAKYKVTANLKDLFGDDITNLSTSRTSIPINCCVSLIGNLMDPTIRFGIELPKSEDLIQNQVRSIINTDEMMMRQVVYLLVFGRFFTPEYLKNTTYSGLNETYSLLSSTITGQINSWLGKLTNVFSMGINIRSDGSGANMSQEYEAQFQLQPVDRLVINGNVGYRYNDITNRPVFGDVDIEYMLTPNGKFRVKGYTHTVDKYSLRQANTVQGIGFLFRHDFNWKKDEDEKQAQAEKRAKRKGAN